MFDAVIFDCDGVLVDSEVLALETELAFLASRGLAYDRLEFARRYIGADVRSMDEGLRADSLARLGAAFDDAVMAEMRAARDADFERRLQPVAGADVSLLAWEGPRAVASSSRHEHLRRNLMRTGLADLVYPDVYSAEEVPRGKPAPDVFLLAARRIGVAPMRCLVIEDSLNGVRAAVSAGMTVWGFLGGGHVWPELGGQLKQAGAVDLAPDHAWLSGRLSSLPR